MQVETPNESALNASFEFICISLTCYFVVSIILIFTNTLVVLVIYLGLYGVLLKLGVFQKIKRLF